VFGAPRNVEHENTVKPSAYTVINAIIRENIPLLDFYYFKVCPGIFRTSRAHGLEASACGAWA
jgi:hypothetical protein